MPYRRRYAPRRRSMRRRTMRSNRLRMGRPPRRLLSSMKLYHFKRTYQGPTITPLTGATTFGAISFNMSSQGTEIPPLFDCYRINKVVCKFVPNRDNANFGGTSYIPNFYSVLDFTDSTIPTSLTELYDYGNLRITRGSIIHTRALVPATNDAIEGPAAIVSGNPRYKQWITTSQMGIPHFGLKYAVDNVGGATDVTYKTFITLYFSCKSVK